ncbi:MAG: AAA family ATPase [Verrucomicrobiales bacterium]|nr:AAA family ATPase [Verrucomicrobiales bacterium]
MKILKLEINGYRSFRSQTWSPGDLNVLIGPNASGKTNLLRALETLCAAASGSLGRYVQQEGGMEPIVWDGRADGVQMSAKMTPLPPYSDPDTDALTYKIDLKRLGSSSAYRIDYEVLGNFYKVETGAMQEPFKLLERDPRHAVVFSMNLQRFQSVRTTTTTTTPYPTDVQPIQASDAALPEEESLLSFAAGPFAANRFVAEFQGELTNWRIHQGFYTHRDAPIRSPQVTRAESQVSADGQNLISVLHSLYMGSREFKRELNEAMRAAFGEDFDELVFPPAADQRIQLRIRWKSLQREQSAADLSDGTLRFLLLIAVLANPDPPPLIAIDEPETGLHPSMLPIIAEYARDASLRCQVILTTHSPELLDAFGDNAPTTTVVERRDGESVLRTIAGSDLAYWLRQYSLGDLYRSRELEAMS